MGRSRFAIAVTALMALSGCTSGGVATPPYPPVPAPLSEIMPKPPVTPEALVWQPGHWDWNGTGYSWQPGDYVPAGGHGSYWQPGWWSLRNDVWRWEPAHWTGG